MLGEGIVKQTQTALIEAALDFLAKTLVYQHTLREGIAARNVAFSQQARDKSGGGSLIHDVPLRLGCRR